MTMQLNFDASTESARSGDPMEAMFFLQDKSKDDKTAKKLVLSINTSIRYLGLDGAEHLILWYIQRYKHALKSVLDRGEPRERIDAFLATLDAAMKVVKLLRLDSRKSFPDRSPKVKLVLEISALFTKHGMACAFFVKQRSVAYCLEGLVRTQLKTAKTGTMLGFNSGLKVRVVVFPVPSDPCV
jgi:hypothetical protein